MKKAISGYYDNHILKSNNYIINKSLKERKFPQSKSETNNKEEFPNHNSSRYNEDNKVKNINIKFNLLNNYKKYNTIFNNKEYKKIIKFNQENLSLNTKLNIKLLNNKSITPKLKTNKNNKSQIDLKKTVVNDNENKGQIQLDPHNYFPEDFSLNIFKSTYIYKKRYKIQTFRLRKVLKNIYQKENSKNNNNIISQIKKNAIKDNFSNEMIQYLKWNKIDKFVNEYLHLNTPLSNQNEKENSKDNNNSNNNNKNIEKIFITDKYQENKKIDYIMPDVIDKNMNKYSYTNINKENKKLNYKKIFNRDNMKTSTVNSATQTINIHDIKKKINDKYSFYNVNRSVDKFLIEHNSKNNINYKNPLVKEQYCNLKQISEMKNVPQKNIFFKKSSRPFSSFDRKRNISSTKIRKNIINKFYRNKKLKYSFYNPEDRFIKLFDELEKRVIDSNKKNPNNANNKN